MAMNGSWANKSYSRSAGFGNFASADLFRQRFERFQNSVGAGIHRDRRNVTPCNDSVLIDDEESALGDAIVRAIDAILLRDGALGLKIGKQGKVQMAGLGERRMAPRSIHRHAQHLGPELVELGQNLIVESHLVAAHRAAVSGIKR